MLEQQLLLQQEPIVTTTRISSSFESDDNLVKSIIDMINFIRAGGNLAQALFVIPIEPNQIGGEKNKEKVKQFVTLLIQSLEVCNEKFDHNIDEVSDYVWKLTMSLPPKKI